MSEMHYNFAAIDAGASAIQSEVLTAQGLLDDGKRSLTALQATWGGSGSESYQAVQQRWDSTAAELNAALQSLSKAITESSQAMQGTEQAVTGMFA
ncbi:WXG100 family type VII secretion target [Mycobacterium spongiae]|uniref:ESAT-6-like protein n=1 Tax=Mycobacterium spongiae TaxID=886343 RepID=A0A975PVW0_9MYCO|nr:WXG100 family type VII secretion target [Mycobacterium spongiae]QUR66520.1 WXG100 family type VII secretion target [Mycobacterium spongiae]